MYIMVLLNASLQEFMSAPVVCAAAEKIVKLLLSQLMRIKQDASYMLRCTLYPYAIKPDWYTNVYLYVMPLCVMFCQDLKLIEI